MKKVSTSLALALLLGAGACKKDKKDDANSAEAQSAKAADDKGAAEAKDEKAAKDDSEKGKEHAHDDGNPSGDHGADKHDLPEDLESGETAHFGADFSVDGDPVSLASALESAGNGEPVKVQARVEKVCKKKGCWFTLQAEDVDRTVRVRMKDYGFFVPRNSDGGDAIVEGTVKRKKLSEKEAEHYAKDQGKDPESVDAEDLKVYRFTATAVEITKS